MPQDQTHRDAARSATRRRGGRAGRGRRGFILVAVIWSLGLITALGSVGIVGARFRGRAAADAVAEGTAAAAADSGLSLGILRALRDGAGAGPSAPLRCVLPDGQRLTVTIADEAGKVDLNMAPAPLLALLFSNLTHDGARGARIAADITAFRDPGREPTSHAVMQRYASDGKPEGPKRAAFATILELDQLVGLRPDLVQAALPFVTVRTGRADVDAARATPAMRRLLGLDTAAPAPAAVPQNGVRSVTVIADATTPDGARFVRQALVSIGGIDTDPYVIREWRRGDRPGPDEAADHDAAAQPPCFSVSPGP